MTILCIVYCIPSNKGNFYQASKHGMGVIPLRATELELQSFTFCNVILKLKLIVPIDSINHLVCIMTDCAHTDLSHFIFFIFIRFVNEEKVLEVEIEPGMTHEYQYPFIAEGRGWSLSHMIVI